MASVRHSPKVDHAAVAAAIEDLRGRGATCQVFMRASGTNVCVHAVNAGKRRWADYSEAGSARAAIDGRRMLPVLDIGDVDDLFWIAYDVDSAKPLAELRNRGPLPTTTALRVLSDLAQALDDAAGEGVFASELPPESVFVSGKGARLGDLGTARAALARATFDLQGDPAYVPPEVLRGKRGGERSGLYLYGALLHYVLTGVAPARRPAAPPGNGHLDLPASINAVVATVMADDPDSRPHSASEAHEMARRALRGEPPARARRPRRAKPGGAKRVTPRAAAAEETHPRGVAATRGTPRVAGTKRAKPPAAAAERVASTVARTKRAASKVSAARRAIPPASAAAERAPSRFAGARLAVPRASAAAKRALSKVAVTRLPVPPAPAAAKRALSTVAAARPPVPWRIAAPPVTQRQAIALGGALILGAGAALLLDTSSASEPPRAETVTASGLSVTLPSGQHRLERGDAGLSVLAPGFRLSARSVDRSLAPPPDARPVQLGALQAWRHAAGGVVRYSIPTSEGSLAITCRKTGSGSSRPLRLCERTASTLRLGDATALTLAAAAEESRRLHTAIEALKAERDAARARLADTFTPDDQRAAAQDLAESHDRAATVFRQFAGAGAIEAAARAVADSYSKLAAAAESGSPELWDEASEGLRRSDAALAEAIAAAG
jgi:hypothetical protein